jgi:hypothetical protein
MILTRTIIFFIIFISYLSASNFTELSGFEDSNGNTHLFYRICIRYSSGGFSNDIYHFDIFNNSDSLYLDDYYFPAIFPEPYGWPSYISVDDLEFWNGNPADFIYCGIENDMLLGKFYLCSSRFDYYWGPEINNLELSNQNDSLVYASNQWAGMLISLKSGSEWQNLNPGYNQLLDISPFDDQILFTTNGKYLYKSINGGLTFSIVDSSMVLEKEFFFDEDSIHIYLVSDNKILASDNFGETWQLLYEDTVKIFISLDASSSGTIYLCRENKILLSQNYGVSFNPYYTLDSNISGIYKKPNSDILYVSTIDHIYQISQGELTTLKTITSIPDKRFSIPNPQSYHLDQNYPNPFNSTTTIQYQIIQPGNVEIRLYSIDGKFVYKVIDTKMPAGEYSVNWDAKDLASGIYFYVLIHNGKVKDTKRLLLIK